MKIPRANNDVSLLMLVALLLVVFGGCTKQSESSVIGEYELKGNNKIELRIFPDKTFSETIFWRSGRSEKRSGKWEWHHGRISFDQLWIPPEFAPDYILDADAHSGSQSKYTEPGLWIVTPENHWRTTTLEIFPDAELSFKMTKSYQ